MKILCSIHRLYLFLLLVSFVFYATAGMAAESPYETIERAASYLLKHQNPDGGWPLVAGEGSDAEVTAMVLLGLMLKGLDTNSDALYKGIIYLTTHQKADGSWNGNTAHTIFALMALTRAETGSEARLKGLKWIKEAQNEDGSWGREKNQAGNPLYTGAVLAGLGQLGFNRSFSPVPKAADWLANHINEDGGWSMMRGASSDVLVTSWVLQGLALAYDIDSQIAWLKQMQNPDWGFGRQKGQPSDPEVTASAILALAAGEDPLNTDKVAAGYLRSVQQKDGSFVSATPIELKEPKANLQTTAFALWAMYARDMKKRK